MSLGFGRKSIWKFHGNAVVRDKEWPQVGAIGNIANRSISDGEESALREWPAPEFFVRSQGAGFVAFEACGRAAVVLLDARASVPAPGYGRERFVIADGILIGSGSDIPVAQEYRV